MNVKSLLMAAVLLAGSNLTCLAAPEATPTSKPAAEQSCPMMKPTPEHTWLQQGVGQWTATTEMPGMNGQPAQKTQGTETVRPIGGFWTVTEVNSEMMKMPFTGNMTLGYDTEKKQYVSTWVDSMTGKLWLYHGTLDKSKKVLTLESEGVCPMHPGQLTQFRDVIEFPDKNHKRFTSAMKGEDGKWMTMVTSMAERVSK